MCAELLADYERNRFRVELAAEARALLDQPAAERPSDWDLKVIMDSVGGPQFDSGPRWMLPFARAVLARYGESTVNSTEA